MVKKTLTTEELTLIYESGIALEGTSSYNKYYMESYYKINGKWSFVGWGTPFKSVSTTIKKVKDNYYIMQGDDRFKVTDEVNKLLNIY
jgi:hypothetical protein